MGDTGCDFRPFLCDGSIKKFIPLRTSDVYRLSPTDIFENLLGDPYVNGYDRESL